MYNRLIDCTSLNIDKVFKTVTKYVRPFQLGNVLFSFDFHDFSSDNENMENTKAYSVVKVIFTVLAISLPFIGFYLGTQYQTLISSTEDQSTLSFLKPRRIPTPTPTPPPPIDLTSQTATSSANTANIKKLIYSLPTDWLTVKDTTNMLEVGYDVNRYEAISQDKRIELLGKWAVQGSDQKRLGGNNYFYFSSYQGGSRHNELYKILGENPTSTGSTMPGYSEREYSYNGWSCLFLNGISISQYPVTWGYCPISSTQALVVGFDTPNWSEIEKQLSTVRVIK